MKVRLFAYTLGYDDRCWGFGTTVFVLSEAGKGGRVLLQGLDKDLLLNAAKSKGWDVEVLDLTPNPHPEPFDL